MNLMLLMSLKKGAALWKYGVHLTERFDETHGYT
jgi:hypothetical protein